MNLHQVRELLRSRKTDTVRTLAREFGVSLPYLSDVLTGRRDPGPKILTQLGLKRVVSVSYEPLSEVQP